MADKKTETKAGDQSQNQDPGFVYGDAPAKKKIDAWEGEGDADLVSDSGEMALANLHFGTTPDAEFLHTASEQEESSADATSSGKADAANRVSVSIEENLEGAVIGSLNAAAGSESDAETDYAVSDARFEVVDGRLVLADGVSLDFETEPALEVTVTSTTSDGVSTTETFNIDVIDTNDAPTDLALDGTSVAENSPGAVIGTLSSFDADGDEGVTYTVSDDRFEIIDGTLQLADGVSLDHEEAASIELTVTATDSGGLSTTETFVIDVLDVNEGPTDLSLDNASVAENEAGAVIGTLSSFDPDAGDTVAYTVSDDRFEVVDGQVRLIDGVSLDHEEAATIELTVTATDSGGLSTTETFTIDVMDVNEGPSDLTLDGTSVSENDEGAIVGTLSSSDPDAGDSVTYTVSDDRFEVVDGQVRLVDGVRLDHEEAASIELTVTATDSGGLSTTETFVIDVLDVNEGPRDLSLDGTSVSENDAGAVIGTLSSFDPDDADTVTYTVSDDRFEVVDGQVRLVDGISLDHEEVASLELTVTATDTGGLSTTETFTIDVLDVNEGPRDLSLDGTSVSENNAGAVIGTLSSFDPDAGDSVTYTVSDDRFEVVDGEVRLVDGVSLDHEEAASLELTVTATDTGGLSTTETFTIDVVDVNEGPSDLSLDGTSVLENDEGAIVGTLSSFDPDDADTVTYTVSDDRFEVVDGQVRLVDGISLDHEEVASLELTVTATDTGGLSTTETFVIDVLDVNEGPSDLALDGTSVLENDTGAIVGTLSSFDPDDADTVTYTVSDDRFEVVDDQVRLVDGVSLDHEEAATLELTVTATDSGGLSTTETFTIDVLDVNEGPRDLSLDGTSVSENDAGVVVGTLTSFDPDDGDSITYTLSDDRFEVVDGQVRLIDGVSLDHEEAATIELTVTATDTGGLSTTETFTIDVLDVNEGPRDLALDGTSVSENDAGAVIGTLSSFDPDDGDTVTYNVSDDRFEVVDGQVRLVDGVSLDHEEAASIELTITATDSGGLSTTETFTIDILDVNEGPSDLALDGATVAENETGAVVGTLSAYDPDDGDSVTYTVSDDRFEVVDGHVRLVDGVSLDHEEAASIELTVTATDTGGLSTTETFTIDVLDVNEGPSDLALDNSSVAENDAGAVIGTLSSFDPDAGDSVTYTVSDDRFEVVEGRLQLAEGISLNHEETDSIDVTVTATDSEGASISEIFTISVEDVNEAPFNLTLTRETGVAEADFSASDGHVGNSVERLGLETDAIVFTMSFTTADDVSSTQTLFETGGSLYGTNVVIEDGMLLIYAGEGNDLELSVPINGDTAYNFALELDKDSNTIRVLLSDELPLDQMNADNSLVASMTDWTDRDYTGGNQMGVGRVGGNSSQGNTGGDFLGEIAEPGLQIFSDSTLSDVFTENGLDENTESAVVGTLSVSDPDAGDSITYTVSDDRFEVVDGELRLADGVTLDHEEASTIDVTVTATDIGGLSTSETFTVNVNDLNEAPTDLSIDNNTIDENTTEGVVGTLSVSDPDAGDTHTFHLVDGDGGPFSIDPNTGEISLVAPGIPDDSVLRIDASDADSITEDSGVRSIQDLSGEGNTIQQTDADERPGLTDDGPFGGPGLEFDGVNDRLDISDDRTLNLSSQTERSFALTIRTGDDVDSRQVIFEEGGTVNGFNFYIDGGQLYMGAWSDSNGWSFEAISIDVEPGESYSIVTVFDGASNTYTAYVNGENVGSVEVGDAMAAHSGNIGLGGIAQHTVFHDGSSSANEGYYFEGSIGEFAVFNDALSSAEVAGIDMDFRDIAPDLDFETRDSYDLTVQVTDAAGESYEEIITLNVNDLNEAPGEVTLDGNTVDENASAAVIGSVSATDPDAGDTLSYAVSDNRFEVVDGQLQLVDGVSLDHEVAETVEITITATDAGGLSSEQTFTINVADLNEAPMDLTLSSQAVAENDAGAVVGTLSAIDPDDGDSLTYSLSDDRFEVVNGEVRLVDGVSLDHEAEETIDLTVTATDENGLSTEETFTISVTDVNEAPSNLALDNTTVAENETGATVGTLTTVDPDAGDAITYTVSDARFEVVDGQLQLADGVSLNHEEVDSLDVTVTATDGAGLSTTETFTIDVTDVNEAPGDIVLTPVGGVLSLNQDGGTDDNAVSANMTDFPTDAITVEVTFTADAMPAGSGAPLFSYAGGGNWGNDVLLWAETGSGNLSVFLGGQQFRTNISNADLFDGEEHTVSFTWDQESGELIVYVDGDEAYSRTVSVSDLPSDGTVSLGQEQDSIGGGYDSRQIFEGEIAEVRIYDEALSPGDIENNAAGQTTQDGLVTHWQMNSATDGVVSDSAGNNDLVLENGADITQVAESGAPAVLENTPGAVIGTLTSSDPDAGDVVSYSVSDDRFEVVDGVLRLAEGVSLDHEAASSLDVAVTATDSGGLSSTETFTIEVVDQNEAPTMLEITPNSENLITGGSFEEQDVRSGGWRGFSEDASGNWDSANGIEVWDNLGGVAASEGNQFLELDYTNAADAISQTVNTEAGQTYTVSFDMRARGSNTTDTIEVYWNGELVGAFDPASTNWEEVSFEVTGTGAGDVLEFREAAGESDSLGAHLDNISLVEVPLTVVENDAGAVVATLSSYDPDAGDVVTYSVSDDRFEVVDGQLRLKDGVSLDYETESSVDVTVTATDTGGLETSETISIDVLDLAEDLELGDGGETYTESGKAEASVTGGDGNDVMTGGAGDDTFAGGEGNDLFIYGQDGGSDTFDGGAGWTDTIDLSDALAADAVYGEDWTITLTEGEIVSEDADSIELSDDAAGVITLDNGETIDFSNVEQIGF
nr:LamG-like jellyroll fold domain-containing protein [Hyphomonas sp. Mor2]